jgi:hypothetical protein
LKELQHSREIEDECHKGVYWMDIKTFMEVFYNTIICHWVPNYSYCSFADTHSTNGHGLARLIVPFDIKEKIVFSLHQIHRRFLDGWIAGTYEYAAMQFYLAKVIRTVPGTKKRSN